MDFYNNKKRVHIFRIILLVCFVILLFVNLYNVFINTYSGSYWGIVANLLLAISMALQIRKYNKEKNIDSL
ncbi:MULTISPECIES: hypothetical protein [unclassified Flavobacterium]|jgi:hypothetical protein|uniref:hypothetical protein n=1 Tax=unclassified Flavobacterium TaxID=196869 RepID=UPI000C179D4D|nr:MULTISPECIES: hypothetical protein [unclassified Flavobacterium]PIF63112.1 hypothetical protein CLV00_2795 [Flavobacterium sp. 11]RKS14024.1 hypothetical protein C8C87_1276 [Flavobacterium sp. 120]WKL44361.1 hypothetical protein Q1W72_01750 [Flavobacterium sp. ZE23DGlu08]